MNKAQLIEALAERLGDKKTASQAVDNVVDLIVRNVNKGEKVNITGFGVFEKRARAARTARNPRTGEAVRVKKTNVPAFRAGTQFKEVVGGQRKLPRTGSSRSTTAGRGTSAAAKSATTTRSTTKSTTASTGTKSSTSKSTGTSSKSTGGAKTTAAKSSGTRTTGSTASKSTGGSRGGAKGTTAKTASRSSTGSTRKSTTRTTRK
ncbi:HU family DNA-binding protein [Actinopolyspora mortivallis]|uniref:HU family DNA-binding protein n=1 Tax=Actinopolyspora mortivallis TaxID=33906 RepID=UPI00037DDC19|nr:HU family DNA-binding protein [Actinopolyspora mortivallis]